MPRAQQTKQLLNFVQGLNTEASPLVFPENTAKDLDNLDLSRDGSLKRRRGLNFEAGGAYSTTTFTDAALDDFAISAHEWMSVTGDDSLNFLVVQVGGTLYFHKLGDAVLSTSIIGSISLSPIQVDADFDKEVIDTDTAKGVLFIVGRSISPAYIIYNKDANSFSGVKITIKIRDTDGIDEEITSPVVFGDDVTPPPGTDPVDDIDDVTTPPAIPDDFDPLTEINAPNPGFL